MPTSFWKRTNTPNVKPKMASAICTAKNTNTTNVRSVCFVTHNFLNPGN